MAKLGHEVKLIAPRYVKPFVKRQKNDAADAEAIMIAAQRPEMRFVLPKRADQQSRAILFRARERLVHQRTELVNALRSSLYEYGHVIPQGIRQIKQIAEILEAPNSDLPDLMREECRDMVEQIGEQTNRINARAGNHTRGRPNDCFGSRSFCTCDGELQLWPRLCGMAGPRSTPVLLRRERTTWSHLQGWAG
jgi:transposase